MTMIPIPGFKSILDLDLYGQHMHEERITGSIIGPVRSSDNDQVVQIFAPCQILGSILGDWSAIAAINFEPCMYKSNKGSHKLGNYCWCQV